MRSSLHHLSPTQGNHHILNDPFDNGELVPFLRVIPFFSRFLSIIRTTSCTYWLVLKAHAFTPLGNPTWLNLASKYIFGSQIELGFNGKYFLSLSRDSLGYSDTHSKQSSTYRRMYSHSTPSHLHASLPSSKSQDQLYMRRIPCGPWWNIIISIFG